MNLMDENEKRESIFAYPLKSDIQSLETFAVDTFSPTHIATYSMDRYILLLNDRIVLQR